MTRNDRRAIVIVGLALIGAQVPGVLSNLRPSHAACSDLGQAVRNYQPGALNQWAESAGTEAGRNIGTVQPKAYYEERPQAAVPQAVERPISMTATPQSIETGDPVADRLDREIAAANGMTLAAYKANPEKARL